MKHIVTIATLLIMGIAACGQTADTAEMIVQRYLDRLGNDRWPADSTLYLETVITSPGSTDTIIMRRWFTPPQMLRVEVRKGRRLQVGLCSNGKDRYRRYHHELNYWVDLQPIDFYDRMIGYDFRGPLHGWKAKGATLTYDGKVKAEGHYDMESVTVEAPNAFKRHYMFEPSGLLAVIIETDELDTAYKDVTGSHIDWKCIHEYMTIGGRMLPRLESFMREGRLTVLETTAKLEERNTLIFNQD